MDRLLRGGRFKEECKLRAEVFFVLLVFFLGSSHNITTRRPTATVKPCRLTFVHNIYLFKCVFIK